MFHVLSTLLTYIHFTLCFIRKSSREKEFLRCFIMFEIFVEESESIYLWTYVFRHSYNPQFEVLKNFYYTGHKIKLSVHHIPEYYHCRKITNNHQCVNFRIQNLPHDSSYAIVTRPRNYSNIPKIMRTTFYFYSKGNWNSEIVKKNCAKWAMHAT